MTLVRVDIGRDDRVSSSVFRLSLFSPHSCDWIVGIFMG